MLLIGLHRVVLDAKGRLAIPALYRPMLEENCQGKLVITIQHHGKSLMLYPENEFEEVARTVRKLSDFDEAEQNFKYLFFGHAIPLEMDSSGRVLVPPLLREQVGIEKRVALVGATNKLELWNEETWLEMQKTLYSTRNNQAIPDKLKDISL
jgi:MraZ protein